MLTEKRNPQTRNLDRMTTAQILQVMNDEDRQIADVVQDALPQIEQAVDVIVERLQQGGRLLYSGAGTSGRLGVLDAVECVPTFGTSPETVQGLIAGGNGAFMQAVEGAEDNVAQGAADLQARDLSAADVVVGIAASGRTPYVLGAIDYARDTGAATAGIACNVPAPLLERADIGIGLPVGAEVIAGSTRLKAGTAQKMVLNMLSTASMVQMGKVYGNLMVDVQVTNEKLAGRARRILVELIDVDDSIAAELLAASGNSVKVAVVMHECDVPKVRAVQLLADANGHLRRVLSSDTNTANGA